AIEQRPDFEYLTRDVKMTLIDRKGRSRERLAEGRRVDTESERRSMIAFTKPKNIKGTAFLSYEYHEGDAEDDKWLYLPAMRRTRRIAGTDRGEYFLGTDFTYEDLKLEGRLEQRDYAFTLASAADSSGDGTITLQGLPHSGDIAKELGYGRILVDIDPATWNILEWRTFDVSGNALKTTTFSDFVEIDGVSIARTIAVNNHKTSHQTIFEFSNLDAALPIEAGELDHQALGR
ncbi:MAG: outer membrane lipoprotein-sorting protein, partial [Gammaproteobacteria bacterium]